VEHGFLPSRHGVWCRDRRDETLYLVHIRVNVNNELLLIFQIFSVLLSISWVWGLASGLVSNDFIFLSSWCVEPQHHQKHRRLCWKSNRKTRRTMVEELLHCVRVVEASGAVPLRSTLTGGSALFIIDQC
jgi:hypothetical protein